MQHQLRINRQFVLKIAAPMVVISLLLFALGISAAHYVHTIYRDSSNLILTEVHNMIAAQDLYIDVREIRHKLLMYGQTADVQHLEEVLRAGERVETHLQTVAQLARAPAEIEEIGVIRETWAKFQAKFQDDRPMLLSSPSASKTILAGLIAGIDDVFVPTRKFLELNRNVVDRTNEANRHTADQTQQGFLLLGICGGAGGLVAGLAIARSISASIVQLDISVRGAAGKLSGIIGPITVTRSGDFRELEAGLAQMKKHITTVVKRLQQHEREALHREQLAALGQLAAGLAHELRNPLTPIKLLVQGALEQSDGNGLSSEQLRLIEGEVARLERLLQDFLDFARPPTPEVKTTDLRQVVGAAVELVQARAQTQGVAIRTRRPDEPVLAEIDSVQMNQVFLNLLLNALDVLVCGNRIDVTIRSSIPASTLAEDLPEESRWHEIVIRDSGRGFDPAVLDRLFEPFVSTKETGTGLGLSICQRIVAAHHGHIAADNADDHGAVITILLPCRGPKVES